MVHTDFVQHCISYYFTSKDNEITSNVLRMTELCFEPVLDLQVGLVLLVAVISLLTSYFILVRIATN
jgi:hypothetical protein